MFRAIVLIQENTPIATLQARRILLSGAEIIVFVIIDGQFANGIEAQAETQQRNDDDGK
jgi:hypothetical protein